MRKTSIKETMVDRSVLIAEFAPYFVLMEEDNNEDR
jgi:hypothetical protein